MAILPYAWVTTVSFSRGLASIRVTLLPQNLDEDRIGAMLALGHGKADELDHGSLEQVLMKGHDGNVLRTHAGDEAVLTVVAKEKAKLGLIFLDVRRVADGIAKML